MKSRKNEPRPILVNGEHYIEAASKKGGFGDTAFPRSYEEGRDLLIQQVNALESQVSSLPAEKKLSEFVFCVRLHEKFIAKSYTPDTFLEDTGLKPIGSRKWYPERAEPTSSKLIFVRAESSNFSRIRSALQVAESKLSKDWIKDVRKLEGLDLLKGTEQLLGFEDWSKGAVEIVLHPFGKLAKEAFDLLFRQLSSLGIKKDLIKTSQYPGGLTFVCTEMKRKDLSVLKGFNPLRTAHPLSFSGVPKLRANVIAEAPHFPVPTRVSKIKVGQFDGGVDVNIPLLANLVKNYDSVPTKPTVDEITHGSAVAGAILHGKLNPYGKGAILPDPPVTVESYRVLPLSQPSDVNLYEVIDKIEEVVPQRNDIKVYNLSMGPCGPILDDEISRFTYAIDSLAYVHKVLFVVATGNDGDTAPPNNRIQSPSDSLNGLGVGSTSYKQEGKRLSVVRADYSCVGPGREGSKLKPDVTAFGGCDNFPFHLVSTTPGQKLSAKGTSLATPLVSRLAAEIMGRSDRIGALMAKTLLIHSSENPETFPDFQFGYGIVKDSADEVLSCHTRKVTVLFQGTMRSGTHAKLPIPFINCEDKVGMYNISWTIGIHTKPDSLNADEYSTTCIEDTFYPNSHVYSFNAPKNTKGKNQFKILDVRHDKAAVQALLAKGWKQSQYPKSASGNIFTKREAELRGENFKWDTVVKRMKRGFLRTICDPFLVLHAMGRNEHEPDADPVHYSVAVTIELSTYQADLHQDILNKYQALLPIEVRAVNELFVQV
jgi:hypothetical protein